MLTNLVDELESEFLPLLVKTTNNRNDHGLYRDCFTLNPSSTTPTHQKMFVFMGNLLGFAIRSKSAMNWHFPPLFWKQLLSEEATAADLEYIDAYSFQVIKDLKSHRESLSPEAFNAAVNETFTTHLSNGHLVELVPGGKEVEVTHENVNEYCDLLVKARLNEANKQMEWVKEGVEYIIKLNILTLLVWEELEVRACGPKEIDVEALKKITEYNTSPENRIVKMFWKMFEKFSQDERRKYLKFVWGRSKLPADTSDLQYKHEVKVYSHLNKSALPEAHTCFF